jgi:hypothetical protein
MFYYLPFERKLCYGLPAVGVEVFQASGVPTSDVFLVVLFFDGTCRVSPVGSV